MLLGHPLEPQRRASGDLLAVAPSDDVLRSTDVNHLGHPVDAVAHDSFDSALQGLGRDWARSTRPNKANGDNPGLGVHADEFDIAAVSLQGGSDHLNGGIDLFQHDSPIQPPVRRSGKILLITPTIVRVDWSTLQVALLAHQGGWDELLLVAVPIVIVIALLALVKRRVEEAARRADADADAPNGD